MKLTLKLLAAFLGLVVLVLAADALLRVKRERDLFDSDMREDQRMVGETLASAIAGAWEARGKIAAQDMASSASHNERGVQIRLVALDGGDTGVALSNADIAAVQAGETRSIRIDTDPGALLTYVPVNAGEGRRGAIEVRESVAEEVKYVHATIRNAEVQAGLMVLLCTVVATFLGFMLVGRPAHVLSEKARRIGAGDLRPDLALRQRDELGTLAVEINNMCEKLTEAGDKIRAETAARLAATDQLRHADRLMTVGKLASGIAHELGTPLNVIGGRAQMIAGGDAKGAEAADCARIISEQAQRMARIIRQLLDFARRGSTQKQEADLRKTAVQTAALLKPMAEKRGVTVAVDAGADVPAEVDEGLIQQALTNMVVNAIQATGEGGRVAITLERVSAQPPVDHGGAKGPFLCVAVQDTGQGMDAAILAHVFEPFFTTKGVGEGTGLGLSVAYGIARDHGGWIDAESSPRTGSVFRLYLPPPSLPPSL
jgi:two-component system, NtrC family, sensor kinase